MVLANLVDKYQVLDTKFIFVFIFIVIKETCLGRGWGHLYLDLATRNHSPPGAFPQGPYETPGFLCAVHMNHIGSVSLCIFWHSYWLKIAET